MTFPQMLREAMGEMTQEQLQARSGVDQRTISSYLRGASEPKLSQLEKLERALPRLRQLRAQQYRSEVA